jgi:excisionase family DNA binding protein
MPRLNPQTQAAGAVAHPIKKALLSVEEFAEAVSLGRTTAFALIRSGQVRSVLVGKRRLVPASEPEAFALRLQEVNLDQSVTDSNRSEYDRNAWNEARGNLRTAVKGLANETSEK